MKVLLYSSVIWVAIAVLCLSAFGQASKSTPLSADVPFKFRIGGQSFKPGTYSFAMAAVNLLAISDAHGRVIARLAVRPLETAAPPATSKLVFRLNKKQVQLSQIQIQGQGLILEVLGPELALPQSAPSGNAAFPIDMSSDRMQGPRLHQ